MYVDIVISNVFNFNNKKNILCIVLALWPGGFRIQPTFALVRVVRGD